MIVLVVGAGFLLLRGGDDGPPHGPAGDRLDTLGVDPADLVERWDETVRSLGAGDALGAPHWALDEGLALERSERNLSEFGLIEVYRRPGGDVVALNVLGAYLTDVDRARFRADAIAAAAATFDLAPDEATKVVDVDLGLASADPQPTGSVERGGRTVVLERTSTNAELRVVHP